MHSKERGWWEQLLAHYEDPSTPIPYLEPSSPSGPDDPQAGLAQRAKSLHHRAFHVDRERANSGLPLSTVKDWSRGASNAPPIAVAFLDLWLRGHGSVVCLHAQAKGETMNDNFWTPITNMLAPGIMYRVKYFRPGMEYGLEIDGDTLLFTRSGDVSIPLFTRDEAEKIGHEGICDWFNDVMNTEAALAQ